MIGWCEMDFTVLKLPKHSHMDGNKWKVKKEKKKDKTFLPTISNLNMAIAWPHFVTSSNSCVWSFFIV